MTSDEANPCVPLMFPVTKKTPNVFATVFILTKNRNLARLAGLEPATLGLEGRCSIRMSYRRFDSFTRIRVRIRPAGYANN